MRDRLIDLLRSIPNMEPQIRGRQQGKTAYIAAHIADHLLANGVIVPPCKVGQTVYVPWRYAFQRGIAIVEVKEIKLYDTDPSHCMFLIDMESDNECFNQSFGGWKTEKSIGNTVFLTREEAEKALAERSGE